MIGRGVKWVLDVENICCDFFGMQVLKVLGWRFSGFRAGAGIALADVQRALNLIRQVMSEEKVVIWLELLRLIASAIADDGRVIEQSGATKPNQRRAMRSVPMPKSLNAPK